MSCLKFLLHLLKSILPNLHEVNVLVHAAVGGKFNFAAEGGKVLGGGKGLAHLVAGARAPSRSIKIMKTERGPRQWPRARDARHRCRRFPTSPVCRPCASESRRGDF